MRQPVPFGKYLLLDRISVGGMAEVFKAKSYGVEGFEKIIAIKRILPTMGEDRDFIKMFIDEAKIAGQLAHANICQIFELGRIDGAHFIAMEYIWGKDLLQIQNRLRKVKQQMAIPMACFCIAKVLEGLDYAHRKRDPLGRPLEIVHRDCSPQNVLVSYEGEVKVIDFGIAKATSRNSRTMAGVLKGKFGYMSPEQVRGLPLDRRSDIFALGTMLFECLTGERLFQGETDFSTLEKVRNVDIPSPRAVNPAIPEAVERVILKALAKDVDDRYQWCSEMLADLQQYLMSEDVVFTAKTLSSWLKETFAQEIERERQQLEQYKRVGRDGLIAGVPAAQAKLDVNEHLGEAGPPEGDSTVLGGPNFDDIEAAAGATPDVSAVPVDRRPAPKGKAAAPPAPGREDYPRGAPTVDDSDFGEEAPTEIFGDEITPPPLAAKPPSGPTAPRPPSSSGAKSAPQKPPPGGRVTAPRGSEPAGPPAMAGSNGPSPLRPAPPGPVSESLQAATVIQPENRPSAPPFAPSVGSPAHGYAPPMAAAPQSSMPPPMAGGPSPRDSGIGQPGLGRTVLGMQAPTNVPNYSGGYRPPQGPPLATPPASPAMGMGGYPQQPYGQQPYGQNPYPPYPGQMPASSGMGAPPPLAPGMPGGMPMGPGMHGGLGMSGGYTPSGAIGAVEPLAPQVEGKRSTLVRDIGIGVAIAALVLVGFLVVKIFVLDKNSSDTADSQSSMATIKVTLPKGVTAELYVDEKKVAWVGDGQSVPLTPGLRRLKLVGPNGAACETPLKVEPGQTNTFECQMAGTPAGTPAAGSAATGSAATGSATEPTAGSAGSATAPAAGSAAAPGSASAAAVEPATDTKTATATAPATDTKTAPATDTKTATAPATDTKTTPATDTHAATKTATDTKSTTSTKTTTTKSNTTTTATTATKTQVKTTPTDSTTATNTVKTAPPPVTTDDPNKGYLSLSSKPSAKIFIDSADTGKRTPAKIQVPPGKHKVSFQLGDDKFSYPVTVKAGETVSVDKDLQ